jgi:quinol monooxygenase YgiN
MTSRIYCIAEFEPKLGHEQELFEKLTSLEPLALREDGCVRYRVTRQIKLRKHHRSQNSRLYLMKSGRVLKRLKRIVLSSI